MIANEDEYQRTVGSIAKNRVKNRYRDIIPCKHVEKDCLVSLTDLSPHRNALFLFLVTLLCLPF